MSRAGHLFGVLERFQLFTISHAVHTSNARAAWLNIRNMCQTSFTSTYDDQSRLPFVFGNETYKESSVGQGDDRWGKGHARRGFLQTPRRVSVHGLVHFVQ